jgi:hypothetical protein
MNVNGDCLEEISGLGKGKERMLRSKEDQNSGEGDRNTLYTYT